MGKQQKEIWALNPGGETLFKSAKPNAILWYIKEFNSVDRFIEHLATKKPQVILILDAEQQSLFESYKTIVRSFTHFCPIIGVCDNFNTHEERQQILSFGFNDCISKPLKEKVVKSTLNYWMNITFDQTNNENNDHGPSEKVVNELLKFMDTSQLEELMKEFKRSTLKQLEQLKEKTSSDVHAELLHDMKGSAASLGFMKIAKSAEQIEMLIKNNDEEEIMEDLRKFVSETVYFLNNFTTGLN